MKGVIFTVFLDMVEETFGLETMDGMVEAVESETSGAYTNIGTYDPSELINMVVWLAKEKEAAVPDLVKAYGKYLFGRLANMYPEFMQGNDEVFGFLEKVDSYIHVEVQKLYPDADLPSFQCRRQGDNVLEMHYESPRCLGDVAEGLIQGCAEYFKVELSIQRKKLDNEGKAEIFTVEKRLAA